MIDIVGRLASEELAEAIWPVTGEELRPSKILGKAEVHNFWRKPENYQATTS